MNDTGYVMRGIPAPLVPRLWPFAEPYVKRALDHSSGEISPADLRAACEAQDVQLWLINKGARVVGAVTTEICIYPQRKHCLVLTIAGSEFDAWVGMVDEALQAWALAQGCDALEAHVRRGFVKRLAPLGYRHLHSVVVKPINKEQNSPQQLQEVEDGR